MDLRPGTTPIVFLSNYIAAKLENKNPSGSIKDRIVELKISSLQLDGTINKNSVLFSILSGEFAVSFAFFCAKKGISCQIMCPKTINTNHLSLCKMFGAEICFSNFNSLKEMTKQKNTLIAQNNNYVYIDFYNRNYLKDLYELTFCQELDLQIKLSHKNIKNIFLYSESGVLAESFKSKFPTVNIYNVKIINGFFNFNGQKKNIVNNLNILTESSINNKIFEKTIEFKFDKVVDNIKNISKKSGLIMDYRTSACYLAAKEYPCTNDDVSVIIFYENGERYIDEILSL